MALLNSNLHVAKLSDNIVDIATEMLARKIRRQPVIDDDGRLIGQITIRQILRAVKAFAWSQERGASA
ncbi:MAG: CBS domain-containing protein [Pseudomonadales bacterium]|nr:CBS domain-containing protein [Pseudomonadales bacterium]